MKSMLCKYYQPLRLEKPSNFRLGQGSPSALKRLGRKIAAHMPATISPRRDLYPMSASTDHAEVAGSLGAMTLAGSVLIRTLR